MAITPEIELAQVPFVDLTAEYRPLKAEIDDVLRGVFEKADYILGQELGVFESEFASFCRTEHAVGVDSGLSALELIMRAHGIGPSHEVIVPANTFIASALAVSSVGASPVLVDVDPETYTVDPSAIEKAITPSTAAVMPVHLYGHPADMDPILEIAQRHGLFVFEDACQAHGARYKGKPVGSLGDAAAFSFFPAKNLGACGDGGIVVTNDSSVAAYVSAARNYGQREKYNHVIRGHNHRLDTLQAAILRVKLRRLEEWNGRRGDHARLYSRLLEGTGLVLPKVASYAEPVWHLFVVRTDQRDELRAYLNERNISCGIHYPRPIHLQEAFRDLDHREGDFPVAERHARQILSLPMYPGLTSTMIEHVAEAIHEFLNARGSR